MLVGTVRFGTSASSQDIGVILIARTLEARMEASESIEELLRRILRACGEGDEAAVEAALVELAESLEDDNDPDGLISAFLQDELPIEGPLSLRVFECLADQVNDDFARLELADVLVSAVQGADSPESAAVMFAALEAFVEKLRGVDDSLIWDSAFTLLAEARRSLPENSSPEARSRLRHAELEERVSSMEYWRAVEDSDFTCLVDTCLDEGFFDVALDGIRFISDEEVCDATEVIHRFVDLLSVWEDPDSGFDPEFLEEAAGVFSDFFKRKDIVDDAHVQRLRSLARP